MEAIVLSAFPIIKVIPFLYVFFSIYCMYRAIIKYKSRRGKIISVTVVFLIFYGPFTWNNINASIKRNLYKKRYAKAKAVFDEKCMGAREKIYRTVDNVEGVLLLNVPPSPSESDYHDRDWIYASFPSTRYGDYYIELFLDRTEEIFPMPEKIDLETFEDMENVPYFGFSYVDFKNDDVIVRYRYKNRWGKFLWRDFRPAEPARYGILLKNHPAPRSSGVAGMKLIIIDTLTNEVLAEKIWYAFDDRVEAGIFKTKRFYSWRGPGHSFCSNEVLVPMCMRYEYNDTIRRFVSKVLHHKGVSR